MWKPVLLLVAALSAFADDPHPTLAIGSQAPNFSLPGVDGKIHQLSDYSASRVLVVVFTCNHCPIAQLYEDRINQLAADYRDRGVSVVAIQPNNPNAIRIDELDCSDLSDSLAEMKIRAAYRHLNYPYLYDGETQSVAEAYGPKATPHVFVFDRRRTLRYEGRFDNSYRQELVKSQEARAAIEAILHDQPVAVAHTGVFGCSTKWKSKEASRLETMRKIESEPVTLATITAADLKTLRENSTDRLLLLSFWSISSATSVGQLPDLEAAFRMYRDRDFNLVSVAVDKPGEEEKALSTLQSQHASSRNLLLGSTNAASLPPVPYTLLIAPGGKIVFEKEGALDMLALRRTILANVPAEYIGFQQYWSLHK